LLYVAKLPACHQVVTNVEGGHGGRVLLCIHLRDGSNAMMPEGFATQSLPVHDQYEGWRGWCLPLIDVTARQPISDGFRAENRVWKLDDGLLVTQLAAPAARTVRSPRLIRHSPADHWVVTHLHRGTTSIETPRGTIEVQEGQSYIWSLGQVSTTKRSKIDRVDLLLSRDTFRDIAPLLDAATGSVLDTPLGRFLGDFLQTLLERLPLLLDGDAPHLTVAISKLVAAGVAPSAARVEAARVLIDVGRLERVRQTVRAHLQSPLLGPQMLCRQVGMSRSNLYRLLESEGGVTSYIQRHRLMEARSRLSDSRNTRSITAMAHDLCFADLSSFSRAFRAMFDVSPGDMRAASAKPGIPHPMPQARQTQACIHFRDLLRQR
jgi:AraC-like DNA-binding protein